VRRLTFTYFDRAGAPTTDPIRVTAIRIALDVEVARARVLMETQASLRNASDR